MKITTVLFDLDGTLLPMNQDEFVKAYFGALAKKLASHGYVPDELIATIWAGTKAMITNNGEETNEKVFWDTFCKKYGKDAIKDEPIFDEFYRNDFSIVKNVCGYNEKAKTVIEITKQKGIKAVLATNPLFPPIATENRIRWAGLEPENFEFYTTYDNSHYCKPNPKYYLEILEKLNLKPQECLMVGNDVSEDMVAEKLGINVFLLIDFIINKTEEDISKYPNGSFDDLIEYLQKI